MFLLFKKNDAVAREMRRELKLVYGSPRVALLGSVIYGVIILIIYILYKLGLIASFLDYMAKCSWYKYFATGLFLAVCILIPRGVAAICDRFTKPPTQADEEDAREFFEGSTEYEVLAAEEERVRLAQRALFRSTDPK